MPSNNSKYSEEMREQTARYIIESGKSATGVAEEIGVDKNTVCSWVREYRRKNHMPTYAEEKGIKAMPIKSDTEYKQRAKDLEQKNKEKDKEIELLKKKLRDEQEKVEILKKSLHIFMQPHE